MDYFITLTTLLAGIVAAYYAWKAYDVTKENTFPQKNAHTQFCIINPLSKELLKLNDFLSRNIDKKIYLNIRFDGENVDFCSYPKNGSIEESVEFSIWLEKFNKGDEGEKLDGFNSSGLSISLEGEVSKHVFWENGGHLIKGYFAVLGHGTKQGHYGARLLPLKIT
ncbi:hypothetical protein [Rouxiella sp. Mn2063]|uniref:hypothetical protein n=1 Tax=Rouxiella sp. Mn2063 TaxID=3395262 RepID=UPI003BD79E96